MKMALFSVMMFGLALNSANARTLQCTASAQDLRANGRKIDTVSKNKVFTVVDDLGSVITGGFEGAFSNCTMDESDASYRFYYGEFIQAQANCADGETIVLSASNLSNKTHQETSTLVGRILSTSVDKASNKLVDQAFRVVCHD